MCRSLSCHYSVSLYVLDGRRNEIKDNINVISIGKSKSKLQRIILSFSYVPFILILSKNKLFHLHDPELLFCALILKLFRKKIILDVHEDYSIDLKNKYWIYKSFRSIVIHSYNFLSSLCYKCSDLVIVATDKIGNTCNSFKLIIKNYPRGERILDTVNQNKCYVFCYVGSISLLRGLDTLLHLSSNFSCTLLLIGKFASKEDEEYYNLNTNPLVKHIGFVEPMYISEYLSKCFIGLHFVRDDENLLDGLPLKILEYVCSGIHVMCTDSQTWKSNFSGLDCIHYVNYEKLNNTSCLIESITNYNLQDQLINSRKVLKEKYVWENQVKSLLAHYEHITDGNSL